MEQAKGIYRQRHPEQTACYKIFRNHYKSFRDSYEERYKWRYGYFRPLIDEEVEKYLKCGIPKYGFARIRCSQCGKEMILPFSCKSRICASCLTKRMFEFEEYIMEEMIKQVPHRHVIFCLPKILRGGFMRNRAYLNDLSRMAWMSIKEFMQETLNRNSVPGGIQQIQTHGNMLNANAHIHSLVTDGLFEENGVFYCMPEYTDKARECLQKTFEKKIYDFALKNRIAAEETIERIKSWTHSGFSVYAGERIYWSRGDKREVNLRHVIRYMNKSFYSGEKVIYHEREHKVFYKGNVVHGVPLPDSYAPFTCEDFIAAVTAHIPNRGQKYINYYGFYSSKNRGMRGDAAVHKKQSGRVKDQKQATEKQRSYKKKWAQLIRKVFEVDPLKCLACGGKMKVVSIIYKKGVIRKILEHLNLWEEDLPPPAEEGYIYEPYTDGYTLTLN
jgi:hypothetical protein